MSLLEIKDVHSYYGAIHALKGITLSVDEGEIVTLIGANGAGKSTTLKTISGIVRPRHGAVVLAGEDLSNVATHDIVTKGISQVPEGRGVFARLTVLENLEMGAYIHNDNQQLADDLARVFDIFPRLKERYKQAAGTLSGGEQQMLAMGRALMARPKVLLLDEPSMGLAPLLVKNIFETIITINNEGTTILLVEQNARMALEIATRGYVIQTGEIVLEDDAKALQSNEMVQKAYLGID
ncbi:ABC transporter ATP-binding protein [Anaerolineales bacterium HSG6]|nr:ABC transporter ATP-binding protein [Anaerolineales bacterium HSG6]MDM8531443.1 ABC transporter ATP-binding protein [Anaerolineales bacterium HSG25]